MRIGDKMRIKLFFENEEAIAKSGIGRAKKHQQQALKCQGIDYTSDHDDDDFDILHTNTVWLKSLNEINKAHKNGKKVVFHAHSTKEDFKNSFVLSNLLAPFYGSWIKYMYNKADIIITPTQYSRDLLTSYGLSNIVSVSNGVDLNSFKKDNNKTKIFRNYFNLSDDEVVIISVGWFFERKGFDTFCEVAMLLPEYKFIWFGDMKMSAPTSNIRKLMNNPPSNVILPGYISGDVIKGAYSGANLFFFPSREETEGIVVLEALASKINVLVRDIPVYDGWLINNKNVYMEHDTDGFVTKIKQIINKEVPDLTEFGYEVAKSKSIESVGEQLKKVYDSVL